MSVAKIKKVLNKVAPVLKVDRDTKQQLAIYVTVSDAVGKLDEDGGSTLFFYERKSKLIKKFYFDKSEISTESFNMAFQELDNYFAEGGR